ncbi:hypothetical protein [Pseudoalteromonas luteoviolacea]|uniref:Uncharacterized protein n=1 Tax=Pseudoalteromonas luteoviolacea S4060-1 TaxID=1365257 RepID=A0A167NIQ0_9GAMM|nr:hypothetical protein [Pseudoalteromonas luteoviolacea]KZN68341.1 hypothetical protein N478_14340 [Pseudoalteromonas luteoviolacea S4060-1]
MLLKKNKFMQMSDGGNTPQIESNAASSTETQHSEGRRKSFHTLTSRQLMMLEKGYGGNGGGQEPPMAIAMASLWRN